MRKSVVFLLIALFFTLPSFCKDKKKKQALPDAVLNAQTVVVMVDPEAGASVTNPNEQVNARAAVERALQKWGRFQIMPGFGGTDPDLVIVVRRESSSPAVLKGGGINQRPSILLGGGGLGVPVSDGSPRMGTQVGPDTDMFTVYISGSGPDSLGMQVWRYSGKGALNGPIVRAVEEFKKAITESEEAKRQNKP